MNDSQLHDLTTQEPQRLRLNWAMLILLALFVALVVGVFSLWVTLRFVAHGD